MSSELAKRIAVVLSAAWALILFADAGLRFWFYNWGDRLLILVIGWALIALAVYGYRWIVKASR